MWFKDQHSVEFICADKAKMCDIEGLKGRVNNEMGTPAAEHYCVHQPHSHYNFRDESEGASLTQVWNIFLIFAVWFILYIHDKLLEDDKRGLNFTALP